MAKETRRFVRYLHQMRRHSHILCELRINIWKLQLNCAYPWAIGRNLCSGRGLQLGVRCAVQWSHIFSKHSHCHRHHHHYHGHNCTHDRVNVLNILNFYIDEDIAIPHACARLSTTTNAYINILDNLREMFCFYLFCLLPVLHTHTRQRVSVRERARSTLFLNYRSDDVYISFFACASRM